MNYLFIHQNFPAQYRHVVRHLADQGHQIYFLTQPNDNAMGGVYKVMYPRDQRGPVNCHAYSLELDRAIHTGASVAEVCRGLLRDRGFRPDLIVGHGGWGETLFVKDVFADVPLLVNFEFYYHASGVDVGFDPEFVSIFNEPSRLRARNGVALMAFQGCDWGHSATAWQRSLHPSELQSRISVLHEGVDTAAARPDASARFTLPSGQVLTARDEVVSYVARNLEPYRGFHIFMRALPQLLRRRKRAQVVIVGGDGVSYGTPPPPLSSYRAMMLQELGDRLDPTRVHFMGLIEYERYLSLLQISSAHVYLTYPFVLSWSLIEALACGCLVIGSSTPPVLEVLQDARNGLLVDFFDHKRLAQRIAEALEGGEQLQPLRQAARALAVAQFDLRTRMLPRWEALFQDLMHGRRTETWSEPPATLAGARR